MSELKFVDACLSGEAFATDIDDYVDRWHESKTRSKLHDFLGLTLQEYGAWVENPEFLKQILFCRKNGVPITDFMHWNSGQLIAARAASESEAHAIIAWLAETGRIE